MSLERETGGSDPNLPDFWEEDLDSLEREERELVRHLEGHEEEDPDQWAKEAAEAEEAERARAMEEFNEEEWAMIAALTDAPAHDAMDTSA